MNDFFPSSNNLTMLFENPTASDTINYKLFCSNLQSPVEDSVKDNYVIVTNIIKYVLKYGLNFFIKLFEPWVFQKYKAVASGVT